MSSNDILLVEDNPYDEALTLEAFKENNLANNIIVARDGAEALDYLFGRGKYADRDLERSPQVVLLDLKLPKVDGLEVLRQIRSNDKTKFQPVVILTSSKEERDLVQGYSLGANAYVRKPVDFNEFTQTVKLLGLFWMLHNELPPAANFVTSSLAQEMPLKG